MRPQEVRIHDVDTTKGNWGIFVQSVVEAQNGKDVFVTLILETECRRRAHQARKLALSTPTSHLETAARRSGVLGQIRNWIETTEGDGSLVVH